MQKVIENQGNLPAYLFHQGRNFKAHEYFGCHFENDCWFFRVWAPHARQVWVGGDFNGWDYKKSEARKISDNGIWEYSSTEPREYDAYKFVLETREGKILFKADPYAVHAETRPGNASTVFSIGGYRWRDSDWLEQRRRTLLYDKPVNIYELHAGSWKTYPDGEPYSYEKLAEELIPYVKEMEEELLEKINSLGIGPGGLGGRVTAFAVNIETYATHIAGLPVAVNICCHVNRHVTRVIG